MHTTRTLALSALAALSLGACTTVPSENSNQNSSSSLSSSASSDYSDVIQHASPQANALVSSPLTVTGQARGTWYFEASFPVKLLDANGNVLVQHYAEAQSDWMTEDFVPYQSTLTFPNPTTATGMLVLEKDNPSGLPENAAMIEIPVRFE